MSKRYTSFEEIDQDLKRLYLQSEISKEELKLAARDVKEDIKPSNLMLGLLGGLATSAVIIKLLTPLASFAIGKILSKYK
jgi:3-oxoacyl-ACP reductase-like protein